jgi:predicted pyridoxine 5'-phosphate oxidase superfamily flavin-nucleotide-binding protein
VGPLRSCASLPVVVAKVFEHIDERLRAFIEAQPVFFVATAPSGAGGHVNVSPKGGAGLFRVTGPRGFAYVDLLGSGIETVAHLRDNGRICVMFAAFDGPPKILRLHGEGRVAQQADPGFDGLLGSFDADAAQRQAVRSIVTVDVTRISDSCGFQVPVMRYERERDQLVRHADNRIRKEGPDAVRAYSTRMNAESLDGLAGIDPLV